MELANILASIFSGIVALLMGFFCWLVYKLYEKMEANVEDVSKKNDQLSEKISELTIRVGTAYNMFENEKEDLELERKEMQVHMQDIRTMISMALLDKGQIQRQLDELWDRTK